MIQRFLSALLTAQLILTPVCKDYFLEARPSASVQVAQDSQLKLILKTHLSTRTSRPGDAFTADLAEPVVVNNRVVLPGTLSGNGSLPAVLITGTVASAEPGRRFSQLRGKSTLILRFEKIRYGEWEEELVANLVSLHDPLNSKQRVSTSSEGEITAKEDLKSDLTKGAIGTGGGTLLGLIFGSVSTGLVIGAIGGGAAVLASKGKNVEMQPGTGMVIQLGRPLDVIPFETIAPDKAETVKPQTPPKISEPKKPEAVSSESEPPEVIPAKEPKVEKLDQ